MIHLMDFQFSDCLAYGPSVFRANSMDTSFFAMEEPALPSQAAGLCSLTCSDSMNRGTFHIRDWKWLIEDSQEKNIAH